MHPVTSIAMQLWAHCHASLRLVAVSVDKNGGQAGPEWPARSSERVVVTGVAHAN